MKRKRNFILTFVDVLIIWSAVVYNPVDTVLDI